MTNPGLVLQIALTIAGLAIVAVGGGNALIPALHDQAVLTQRWLDEPSFAELVVLSQIVPGPNMILIPLIGWRTAGAAGAFVALVAFIAPSTTIAIVGSRLIARTADRRPTVAFRWALRPVTGGLILASAVVLVQTAARTWPTASPLTPALLSVLALAVAILAVRFKTNPLVWLGAAALIGALL
jgi:chromate transporter